MPAALQPNGYIIHAHDGYVNCFPNKFAVGRHQESNHRMYLHSIAPWCSIKSWKYFGYTPKFPGAIPNY